MPTTPFVSSPGCTLPDGSSSSPCGGSLPLGPLEAFILDPSNSRTFVYEQLLLNFYDSDYDNLLEEDGASPKNKSSIVKRTLGFLKSQLRSIPKTRTEVDDYIIKVIGATSEVVDAMTELRAVTNQAIEELGPMAKNELRNFVFPKKKTLEPGTLCYYRPHKARLHATRSTIQSQLKKQGSLPQFLYKYNGVYDPRKNRSSTIPHYLEDVACSHIYTPVKSDDYKDTVVMFLGYSPIHSSEDTSKQGPSTTDYLHSKCEILAGEQKLTLGFPKLPWSRHMIPDDILIPV
jgi:hypothetical protein